METHRIVSLAFHIACSLALYKLLYDLLRVVRRSDPWRDLGHAAASRDLGVHRCCGVAVHPVAVYGRVTSSSGPSSCHSVFAPFAHLFVRGWSAAGRRTRSLRRSCSHRGALQGTQRAAARCGRVGGAIAELRQALRHPLRRPLPLGLRAGGDLRGAPC